MKRKVVKKMYLKGTNYPVNVGDKIEHTEKLTVCSCPLKTTTYVETYYVREDNIESLKAHGHIDVVEKIVNVAPKKLEDILNESDMTTYKTLLKSAPSIALSFVLKKASDYLKEDNRKSSMVWVYNKATEVAQLLEVTSNINLNEIAWFKDVEDLECALNLYKNSVGCQK